MWTTVLAVAGTLLGSAVTGLLQHRAASAARAADRADARQHAILDAVAALAAALADHRRAMWVREDLRLRGAPADAIAAARAESHTTRSAITAPLTRLAVLSPALAATAHDAARSTYALRDAPDAQTLADRRETALDAAERLITTASQTLA